MMNFPPDYESNRFLFQDQHLLFFLRKSLKETINIGANWMVHTAPWGKILDNPKWPADVKDSNVKVINNNSGADIDESDDDFDDDSDVDLSLSDLEFEEDEVDSLLKTIE
jgi:hypothetical protein